MKRRSRKSIIIEEAAKLFTSKGYPSTSIRELALQVGIEPSSIYSHIKSKEELLTSICMEAAHYFQDGMKEVLNSDNNVQEKINLLIDLHIDAVRKMPSAITVFTDEWKHLPDDAMKEFLEIRKSYQSNWEDIIVEGINEGTVADVDPFILRNSILSSLRWVHYLNASKKNPDINALRTEVKRIILKGFLL